MEAILTITKDNETISTFKYEGEEALFYLAELLVKKLKGHSDAKVWAVLHKDTSAQEIKGESTTYNGFTYHWQFKGKGIDRII